MFEGVLRRLAEALDAVMIPYMVIGGQAVLLYGEPRLTDDVDITVGVAPDQLPAVQGALVGAGFKPLVEAGFVEQTLVLPCADEQSGVRVDVVFSFAGFEREAMGRTHQVELDGTLIRFVSLDDLIVLKVVAGRPRDIEDVRTVLLKSPEVDGDHIRRWLGLFEEVLDAPLRETFDAVRRELER